MANGLDQKCRLCLNDLVKKEKHFVFENSLVMRILVVASVEISTSDSLPKSICTDCRYQLEKSYFFRIKAKQNQTKMKKHIKLLKAGKSSNLLDSEINSDFEDDEIEEQYQQACNFFEKIDKENNDLVFNMKAEMEQKLLEQRIDLVTQFEKEKKQILKESLKNAQKAALKIVLEKTQKLLQDEINISDDDVSPKTSSTSTPPTVEPNKIEKRPTRSSNGRSNVNIISVETPKSLNVLPALVSDVEEADKEVYTIVDSTFKSENPDSEDEEEPDEMIFYDEVDDDIEANDADFKEQEHLLILDYNNEQQEGLKEQPAQEDDNVNEAGELKIFKCHICSQGFTRAGFLKAHQAKHNKKGGYECVVANCGKLFPTNHSLERHTRSHTGEKPFRCNHSGCQKSFAQKEILKRHQLVHSGLTPFKCVLCTSEFRQKILLKQHMQRKHSENSTEGCSLKFKCLWCPKEFAHQSGLSRHNLTHTGKVFTCLQCQKTFSDNSALRRHEMTHNKKDVSAKKLKQV